MPDTLRTVLRRFGLLRDASAPLPRSPEEMRHLLGEREGVSEDQEQMLVSLLQFRDTLAREVMTPRRDIVALAVTASLEETLELVRAEGHSRIPVYRDAIDDVVGVLLLKDLLAVVTQEPGRPFDLAALMREPYFVPDSKPIVELLPELRRRSVHMAILLDEFGGTEGLITLEDMIEEIVGDIYDEHDDPEETPFEVMGSGDVLIDGGTSIFEANERLGLGLPEEDYDTIGGYVFGELGRIPVPGDVVVVEGEGELHVAEVEDRRILRVRLTRTDVPEAGAP
ncbi:MAG: hemolysin family protein [Gemmatimonadota bacterium]